MYADYFLDYASYVILERAVPKINDGFKPVQRRILHAMDRLDDGRYNKVANIVGDTMKSHPHGDRSIADALVGLGQKGLLIDTQGNWGNILTGDPAAASRYIEARFTSFARDVVFSPKVTEWQLSYDGRNKEPVSLPVTLLLAQGAEGIAVGFPVKILPHNFNELIEASIAYLRGQPFQLLPDFPTGGVMDATNYRDGERGTGRVRIRARILTESKKLLRITEIPFGVTTEILIDSIVSAAEKGKLKSPALRTIRPSMWTSWSISRPERIRSRRGKPCSPSPLVKSASPRMPASLWRKNPGSCVSATSCATIRTPPRKSCARSRKSDSRN